MRGVFLVFFGGGGGGGGAWKSEVTQLQSGLTRGKIQGTSTHKRYSSSSEVWVILY